MPPKKASSLEAKANREAVKAAKAQQKQAGYLLAAANANLKAAQGKSKKK